MEEKEFIYGGMVRTRFSSGVEINDEFLKYVGNVALKAIVSELHEEIQTHEVIRHILETATEELKTKKVEL